MHYLFGGFKNLTSIDLSNFNISNAKSFEEMFSECKSIKELNLKSFNTSND